MTTDLVSDALELASTISGPDDWPASPVGAGVALIKIFMRHARRNDRALAAATEQDWRDRIAHVQSVLRLMATEARHVSERVDAVESQFQERIASAEAGRLVDNYDREWEQEPTNERRRMLEHAEAGIVDVGLSMAELARVQRTLRELDPLDVMVLRGLDRVASPFWKGELRTSVDWVRYAIANTLPSFDSLLASGCLRQGLPGGLWGGDAPLGGTAVVTQVGRLILRVLRSYCVTRPDLFDVPGREVVPGERTEAEAWAKINSVDGLGAIARRSKRRAYYDFPKVIGVKNAVARPHNAKAVLRLRDVDDEHARRIAASVPVDLSQQSPQVGQPIDEILAGISAQEGFPELVVWGPHDILRWLADDVDAWWTV